MSWLAPTIRLVRWSSLVVAAAVALSGLLRLSGERVPPTMVVFIAAAVAAAGPASLDDPAHDLLDPMPTTRRRRVLHRLSIAVPAIGAGWTLAALAMFRGDDRWTETLQPLGALVALGVAATCIAARTRPDSAAAIGVAAPLTAATVQWLRPPGELLGSISQVWLDHPWPTMAVAMAAVVIAPSDAVIDYRR